MRFFYSTLYTVAFFLLLPYYALAGLLRGKYLSSILQRLGEIPVNVVGPVCWIHAVSVGEFLAAKVLIRRIQDEFPDVPLVISTTTITGQRLALAMLPGRSFYFPFDWRWCIRKVFRRIQPGLILVLETEIWPNFLWEAEKQGIPVLLINGRISDSSFGGYSRIRRWLPKFEECWMQTAEDATRMSYLGACRASVSVMGNLKFDFRPQVLKQDLRQRLEGWKGTRILWIAGSTMRGEEETVLDAFEVLNRSDHIRLMIAPRHPERFQEVASFIQRRGFSVSLRSEEDTGDAPILLLDSIGELSACYEMADLVLVGGTLQLPGGGHNPIEPAYFGKAIISGPYYQNFRMVNEEFLRNDAIRIIPAAADLCDEVARLIDDDAERERMGEAARLVVREHEGATAKILERVRHYIHARNMVRQDTKLPV